MLTSTFIWASAWWTLIEIVLTTIWLLTPACQLVFTINFQSTCTIGPLGYAFHNNALTGWIHVKMCVCVCAHIHRVRLHRSRETQTWELLRRISPYFWKSERIVKRLCLHCLDNAALGGGGGGALYPISVMALIQFSTLCTIITANEIHKMSILSS